MRRPAGHLPGLLLVTAAIVTAAVVAVAGVREPTEARPPSPRSPIPADAFRPLTLPDRPTTSAGRPLPRLPMETDVTSPDAATRGRPDMAAPATPEPSRPRGPEHIVRPGDTIWQIVALHRADLASTLRWNAGVDPRRLVAGQRILVPGGAVMPAPPRQAPPNRAVRPVNPTVTGRHLWPLPVRGMITTRFSGRHPGIDIAAPAGTAVRAIAAGTVTWAGWKTNGGGYVVAIRHPGGMVSTYNHNRAVAVRVGQFVRTGQLIAWVGASGWATGPHLDIRVEMGGRLINPLAIF